jgi:ATP-dependent helicase/nuclease subunit A
MPLVDQTARDMIRTRFDCNMVVEAAAGTGKTTELVERIIGILGQGVTTVGCIVAVTFTEKAAGELKLRLRSKLEETRSQATDPARRSRLDSAMAHLEEARVSTIHSLCTDLLRERPVEAGIDPQFEVLNESKSRRVYRQALRYWLQKKLEDPPEGLRRLLRRHSRQPITEVLFSAGWKLAQWRDFTAPWRRPAFSRQQQIDELLVLLHAFADIASKPTRKDNKFFAMTAATRLLSANLRISESTRPRDYDELEALFVKVAESSEYSDFRAATGGSAKFNEQTTREEVQKAHSELLSAVNDLATKANADVAALLQCELKESIVDYQKQKEQTGQLDFLDLLIRTRDLLTSSERVRRYFQQRFSHFFIDEFQDTDPLQAEILLLLSSDDPGTSDWRQARPPAGKLFIVGDPKQAIYRFRRADLGIYEEVKQGLIGQGAAFVELSTSFRAVPTLQSAINKAFAPEMTGDEPRLQARYVPLAPFRPDYDAQPSLIALPVPRPYGKHRFSQLEVNASLPDAIASLVSWLIKESGWTITEKGDANERVPLAPRHICLLFRRFYSLDEDMARPYLRALESRDLPHLLVGGRSFHDREEVQMMRTALAAIEWPDDELSVFATLKGSLFAIRDDVLLLYRHRYRRLHPFRLPPEAVQQDLEPVVQALKMLQRLHRSRNYRPIAETIEILLRETRIHAALVLRPSGEQVLANVLRIADLARRYEASGGFSFRGFVEELEEGADATETAEAPIIEEGSEGIRLMSVHKAKGLEFPIVILADITAKISSGRPDRYIDSEAGLCAISLANCAPLELQENAPAELARDEAEGVRVVYVAATRARDMLIVPTVGDHPFGKWSAIDRWWVRPLYQAIYPPKDQYRKPEKSAACPPFGKDSVCDRPDPTAPLDENVCPGLYHFDEGSREYSVVWWDPKILKLHVRQSFGLRQEELLAAPDPEIVKQSLESYDQWRTGLETARRQASQPTLDIRTATAAARIASQLHDGPLPDIDLIELQRESERPPGARFGTLVHAILATVPLGANPEAVARIAALQGRILGCTNDEVAAASPLVNNVLTHELISRARQAISRGHCRRETPITLTRQDGTIVEGVVDLAFLELDCWTVVDFKTDRELGKELDHYKRQLGLYVTAIERATAQRGRGILFGI